MKQNPGAWHRSCRTTTKPVALWPIFITLLVVAILGIFCTTDLLRAQSSPWQSVGTGDCPGQDVSSSTGPTPDPAKCDAAFAGFTAVCWSGACTYKNVPTASCTGGVNPGSMFNCVPISPLTTAPSAPPTAVDLGTTWTVVEDNTWFGTWTRRADTNVFDAVWKNRSDQVVKDTVELQPLVGDKVSLFRAGNKGRYTGILAADGKHITGTASWYSPSQTWTATINTSNVPESIFGEWEIYRGGPVGTPEEDKPIVSGMLVLWDDSGTCQGRMAFERRQKWEDLPDLTFDKGVLTFSRAPTERRPTPQVFRAVVSGDKLAGTVQQDSKTQKWWGRKMRRDRPSAP